MEEYQKQLRQRPHMISINNSNNIKRKEEKKKKNSKYPTRTSKPKYQYKVIMFELLNQNKLSFTGTITFNISGSSIVVHSCNI